MASFSLSAFQYDFTEANLLPKELFAVSNFSYRYSQALRYHLPWLKPPLLVLFYALFLGEFKTEGSRDGLVYVKPTVCQGDGGRPLVFVC